MHLLLSAGTELQLCIFDGYVARAEDGVKADVAYIGQLWLSYLKHQLSFLRGETKVMGKIINGNIRKVIQLLVTEQSLLNVAPGDDEETKIKKSELVATSWDAIAKFYPGMQKSVTQDNAE